MSNSRSGGKEHPGADAGVSLHTERKSPAHQRLARPSNPPVARHGAALDQKRRRIRAAFAGLAVVVFLAADLLPARAVERAQPDAHHVFERGSFDDTAAGGLAERDGRTHVNVNLRPDPPIQSTEEASEWSLEQGEYGYSFDLSKDFLGVCPDCIADDGLRRFVATTPR